MINELNDDKKNPLIIFLIMIILSFDISKRVNIINTPIQATFISNCFGHGKDNFTEDKEQINFSSGISLNYNKVTATRYDKGKKGELTLGLFYRKDATILNRSNQNINIVERIPDMEPFHIQENSFINTNGSNYTSALNTPMRTSRVSQKPTDEFRSAEENLDNLMLKSPKFNRHSSKMSSQNQY